MTSLGGGKEWKRYIKLTAGLLACKLIFFATLGFGQSLGEFARQERERRRRAPRRTARVYINEDLARPRILDPQDRARFAPTHKSFASTRATQAPKVPPPAPPPGPTVPVLGTPREVSLGNVARYYRQRRLRESTRASRADGPALWTNDHFLVRPSQLGTRKPVEMTAEEKELLESYKELGSGEREILTSELERDISEIPPAIDTLREQYYYERDAAKRSEISQERQRLELILRRKRRELELMEIAATTASS